MTYEYKDPTERGFKRVKLSKKDHNRFFPRIPKTPWNRFEYFINEDEFILEQYYSFITMAIQVLLFPVVFVGEGLFNFRETVTDYKRMFRQKHYGAFVRDTVFASRSSSFDEIKNSVY